MLELRVDKVKEGMTGCQDAASWRGRNGAVVTMLSSELILCLDPSEKLTND